MEFTSWNPKELYHFGTKGMKWGQRRFQNPDGSLTPLGEQRYGKNGKRGSIGRSMDLNKLDRERTLAKSKADYYSARASDRMSRKVYRANKKGLAAPVADEKTKKFQAKADEYSKLAKNSQKMVDRIIKNSAGKKMSIRSKTVVREGMNGLTAGTHYRVKNDGKGNRAHLQRDAQRMINNAYNAKARRAAIYGTMLGKQIATNRQNGISRYVHNNQDTLREQRLRRLMKYNYR
jgi:hypothetical protein